MPKDRTPKVPHAVKAAVKRTGLHKLSCWECAEGAAYLTVPAIERGHVPICFCGGRLVPDRFDLAPLVLAEEELPLHPEWAEYQNRLAGAVHGQASHVQRGKVTRAPETVALEHVARSRCESARAAKLAALCPVPASAALPF